MIVKVQLYANELGDVSARIQDATGKTRMHSHLTQALCARMAGHAFRYFHADVEHGSLQLGEVAPVQSW